MKYRSAFSSSRGGIRLVVFGRLTVVADPDEAKHGLQLLMDKHFPELRPGVDYEAATDDDLKVTAVFRVDIEAWSGKEKPR